MAKKSAKQVKEEAIKFKVTDSIFKLMHQWIMTLQEVYTEYYKQVTDPNANPEERNRAVGNMLFMIDFIDAPEHTTMPNLKNQEARDALKGMLATARGLKTHMRTDIERQSSSTPPDLHDLAAEVDNQLSKIDKG